MTSIVDPHGYADLLLAGHWFHALPEDLRRQILDLGVIRRLAPHEKLFSRGDPFCGIYAVVAGSLRITGTNERGKEAILTFIEPPDWFGEIALFDRQVRTHDAIAEEPATVIQIPGQSLQRLLDAYPQYWREFALLLTHKLRLAFMAMEDMTLLPAPVRLSRRLVLMAEGYGNWRDRSLKVIPVQQEQLGMMLGISRQTVNQVLKDLQARRIVRIAYGEVEILDLESLRHEGNVR